MLLGMVGVVGVGDDGSEPENVHHTTRGQSSPHHQTLVYTSVHFYTPDFMGAIVGTVLFSIAQLFFNE